jgi:hypothetical protein
VCIEDSDPSDSDDRPGDDEVAEPVVARPDLAAEAARRSMMAIEANRRATLGAGSFTLESNRAAEAGVNAAKGGLRHAFAADPLHRQRALARVAQVSQEMIRQRELNERSAVIQARVDGATAAPSPSLFPGSTGPRDPYGLGPDATPPRLGSSRRTRRSLEQDIELAGSSVRFSPPAPSAAYAAAVAQPPEAALRGADEFDRALFGLATELDPWQSGAQAHLALVDYSEFRFVAESFRRWILCARRPTAPRPAALPSVTRHSTTSLWP